MFLPITTPGREVRLKPVTSNGQLGLRSRQCRPTWANSEGIEVATCGSLASMAWPLTVREPASTQELEPRSASERREPSSSGSRLLSRCTFSSAPLAPRSWSPVSPDSGPADPRRASGSKAPFTTAPRPTMGSWPSRGIGRVEHRGPGRAERTGQDRPLRLLLEVRAQVPGHHLEPGQRVDGGPRLRFVVQALQVEQGVLQRQVPRTAVGQVGVHAARVRVEVAPARRRQQRKLRFGDPPPAQRPDVGVGLDLRRAIELREPSRGEVPPEVHLVEAVLRVHEALGGEQVLGGVRIDLGHAVRVPQHLDVAAQPSDVHPAVDLGKGLAHGSDGDAGQRTGGQHQDDHGEDQPTG